MNISLHILNFINHLIYNVYQYLRFYIILVFNQTSPFLPNIRGFKMMLKFMIARPES